MDISRKLGIVVLFMAPAIVGGGIVYTLFHNYAAVIAYEVLLLLIAGGFVSK